MNKIKAQEIVQLRVHHLLCSLGFEGKGYSPEFVENMWGIVDQLRRDDSTLVEIVEGLDSTCVPCPRNLGHGQCRQQSIVMQLDKNHTEVLGVKVGEILTYGKVKALIVQHMTMQKFHKACELCAWKNAGMCEKALLKLRNEKAAEV